MENNAAETESILVRRLSQSTQKYDHMGVGMLFFSAVTNPSFLCFVSSIHVFWPCVCACMCMCFTFLVSIPAEFRTSPGKFIVFFFNLGFTVKNAFPHISGKTNIYIYINTFMFVRRGSTRVKVTSGYKEEQCAPALSLEMKKPVDLEAPITRWGEVLQSFYLLLCCVCLSICIIFAQTPISTQNTCSYPKMYVSFHIFKA